MDDEVVPRSSHPLHRQVNLIEFGVAGWIKTFEKFEVFLRVTARLHRLSAKGFLLEDSLFVE